MTRFTVFGILTKRRNSISHPVDMAIKERVNDVAHMIVDNLPDYRITFIIGKNCME